MLKELAQRIRGSPEGEFTPSPPPRRLHEITDSLLIIASDAVSEVGSEQPPLSKNGILKLLAWTVADARGATTPLDKPLALTIGKRLERQAASVRAKLQAIRARWLDARTDIHLKVRADTGAAAMLPTLIESALESERVELCDARTEVYIGFHELESLLEESAEPAPAPASTLPASAPVPELASSPEPARTPKVHFPWLLDEEPWEECPIPPDLIAALDDAEAVEQLWEHSRRWAVQPDCAAHWWAMGLPRFAVTLVCEAKAHEAEKVQLRRHNEDIDALSRRIDETRDGCVKDNAELEDENDQLRAQLAAAKAREDGLKQAIVLMAGTG